MQLIILEGVDGVGKSSIFDELIKNNPKITRSIHWSAPPKTYEGTAKKYWNDILASHLGNVDGASLLPDSIVVWDRGFLGNYIYGHFFSDQPTLSLEESNNILSLISTIFDNITIIQPIASKATLEQRLAIRGETYIDASDAFSIQKMYMNMFKNMKAIKECGNIEYHVIKNDSDDSLELVIADVKSKCKL